jgi:hypothetical protein
VGLQVIGSGLGRTGTASLKRALDELGLGPCHHMMEVLAQPECVPLWLDAFDGRPDWEAVYAGYNSAVDAPTCRFWRELAAYYPDAKVVHTVRDPDAWFESTQASVFAPDSGTLNPEPPYDRFFEKNLRFWGGRHHDRAHLIDTFNRHNAEVVANVPTERLLVYQVGQGWEPLCAFLGLPVPTAPFPLANTREEFAARTAARNAARAASRP